jgi:hypothetical protein
MLLNEQFKHLKIISSQHYVLPIPLGGLLLLARNIENPYYLFIHSTRATNADGAPVAEEKTE